MQTEKFSSYVEIQYTIFPQSKLKKTAEICDRVSSSLLLFAYQSLKGQSLGKWCTFSLSSLCFHSSLNCSIIYFTEWIQFSCNGPCTVKDPRAKQDCRSKCIPFSLFFCHRLNWINRGAGLSFYLKPLKSHVLRNSFHDYRAFCDTKRLQKTKSHWGHALTLTLQSLHIFCIKVPRKSSK